MKAKCKFEKKEKRQIPLYAITVSWRNFFQQACSFFYRKSSWISTIHPGIFLRWASCLVCSLYPIFSSDPFRTTKTPVLHKHGISTSCWDNDGMTKENQVTFFCFFISEFAKRNRKIQCFCQVIQSWKNTCGSLEELKKILWFKQLPVGYPCKILTEISATKNSPRFSPRSRWDLKISSRFSPRSRRDLKISVAKNSPRISTRFQVRS